MLFLSLDLYIIKTIIFICDFIMLIKTTLFLSTLLSSFTLYAQPTSLDQYLIQERIISSDYKITNKNRLNDVLQALSEENSRVLPYQVDENTVLEQVMSYADHIEVQGLIVTPDFRQFAQSVGQNKVEQLFRKGVINNCSHFFEHEFQRVNPYELNMTLNSDYGRYQIKMKNTQCKF